MTPPPFALAAVGLRVYHPTVEWNLAVGFKLRTARRRAALVAQAEIAIALDAWRRRGRR